jgi:predicted metal-dependent enzyme (double-stranded beta helix superfamily)
MSGKQRPQGEDGAAEVVATIRAGQEHVDAVTEAVRGLVRDPERLERALGPEDRCGITVLGSSPTLTIQRVVWPAGIRVPPHDHRMWAVVGVYRGREDNALFRRDGRGLARAGGQPVEQGDVFVLDADSIHAVANCTGTPCVALHVYGGDLDRTPRSTWTPDERPFDPDGMWRAIARFRAREDELGRALTPDETASLMPSR